MRARRDRHRRRSHRRPPRPRASGVAWLGVQQRDRDPRRAPRSRPPLVPAPPRRRELRTGVMGRRDGRHRRRAPRNQGAARRLVDRRLHRQSDRVQRARVGRDDAVPPGARHAADLHGGHAGLQQQVRGERIRLRVEHGAPRPRLRAHRLPPHPRLEPRRLPYELHFHRRADRSPPPDRSARRQGALREPAPDRIGEVGRRRADPDPTRHRRLLPGRPCSTSWSGSAASTRPSSARTGSTSRGSARSSRPIRPSA